MGAVIDETTDLAQLAETYIVVSRALQKRGGLLAYLLEMAEIELTIQVAKEAKRRMVSVSVAERDQIPAAAGVTAISSTSRSRRRPAAPAAV